MTTQTTMQAGKGGPRRLLGATAVTLAVVAGAALWLARPGGEAAVPADDRAVAMEAAAEMATGAAQARQAEAGHGDDVVGGDEVATYYLVGSEAQAADARHWLAEADAIRAMTGEPPLTGEVVLLRTAAEEAHFRWAMNEANAIRNYEGLTLFRVVDLRGTA
jgi:hypothetical protein